MELTVMSGFTNNPPISHVCKPRDRNYHHGTTYATRHTCVTRTVTLNGLRHLLWLLLMWRSNLKKKARRKRRAVYRQGCSICKVTDGQEEFGGFSRKERRRHPSSQVSPPIWNAGAWPGIPHAGFTQEHSVPSVGHKQTRKSLLRLPRPSHKCKIFIAKDN